jgi:hypothetical protein
LLVTEITALVVAAVSLLMGFVLGNRFAELDMELRERRVARQRQALHDAFTEQRRRHGADRKPARTGGGNPRDEAEHTD